MQFIINIEGLALFYNRPDDSGTDLWMLADAHHLGRIETSSGVLASSSGILTPSEISLAGWGVTICQGANRKEIPAGKVAMPHPDNDADRLPRVSDFNTNKSIRGELKAATPDKLPPTLNSMIRLRGGAVKNEPPDQGAKYKDADWNFGNGTVRKLTHRFTYTVDIAEEPISLVFTRGSFTEWVELDKRSNKVTIKLVTDDVKGHRNIHEDRRTRKATLNEWTTHHRCFEVPDEVVPITDLIDDPVGSGPIGGADPMCPGGQIP